jgi:2'-5' RNA ligase
VENYHITLRFIGDVDCPTADEVINAFDRIDRSQAFSLIAVRHGLFRLEEAAFDLGGSFTIAPN